MFLLGVFLALKHDLLLPRGEIKRQREIRMPPSSVPPLDRYLREDFLFTVV